jgi:hypothetical protein
MDHVDWLDAKTVQELANTLAQQVLPGGIVIWRSASLSPPYTKVRAAWVLPGSWDPTGRAARDTHCQVKYPLVRPECSACSCFTCCACSCAQTWSWIGVMYHSTDKHAIIMKRLTVANCEGSAPCCAELSTSPWVHVVPRSCTQNAAAGAWSVCTWASLSSSVLTQDCVCDGYCCCRCR